jgi:hypothetical protein
MSSAESFKPAGIPSRIAVRPGPWDSPDVRNLNMDLPFLMLFSIALLFL